jgi:hypothetical protein
MFCYSVNVKQPEEDRLTKFTEPKEVQMYTNLRSKFLFIAVAVVAIVVAVLLITPKISASKNNAPYIGMGDLRRFEAQQASQDAGKLLADHPYIGMGDLRRFEAQQACQDAGKLFADHPYIGMGDLRIFEYMKENGVTTDPAHAVR